MDMEKINGLFYCKIVGKILPNSFVQVDDVLTDDVVDKKQSLSGIEPEDFYEHQDSEIDVFLLFPKVHVREGVRYKTSVPCTRKSHNSRNITGFGCHENTFDCFESVFAWCFLKEPKKSL